MKLIWTWLLCRPADMHLQLTYSGKLSREKTCREFRGFVAIRESFLREIFRCAVLLAWQK